MNDIETQLDFYLVELREPDPWAYAIYHFRTAANVYSRVYLGYVPRQQSSLPRPGVIQCPCW